MRVFDPRWSIVLALATACSPESPSSESNLNQAPRVWVSAQEPQATDAGYTVRFDWGGADPDGRISGFEYLITNNTDRMVDPNTVAGEWTATSSSGAELAFANDDVASHTFVVRALDDEMLPSDEPDYISFTPKQLIAGVRITVPPSFALNPADVPSISTFEWAEDAGKQAPDSVQWAMVNIREHGNNFNLTVNYLRDPASAPDWYPWVWFDAPAGKGKRWTTPPMELGSYVFAIRAKNVAGAMNPVLVEPTNVRRVRIALRTSGPVLAVQHPLMGRIVTGSCDFPLTIVDIAAHLPLAFTLQACADAYGGVVTGYRYGWDILDHDDPGQWEIDFTPFNGPAAVTAPRAFSFGTHTFSAEAIDNSGYCSRIEIRINIVPVTGERNLLVIDDYAPDRVAGQAGWVLTNGIMPDDAEHDAFWLDMVSNVDQFDPAIDVIDVSEHPSIPVATLASYKCIVWSAYSNVDAVQPSSLPLLYQFIQYRWSRVPKAHEPPLCGFTGGVVGEVQTNFVAQVMQAGVHLLIAGNHPTQNVRSRTRSPVVRWPMLPLYELEPGSTQTGTQPITLANRPGEVEFAWQSLCLDAIDFADLTITQARLSGSGANQRYCPINQWRSINGSSVRDDALRSAIPLDPSFSPIALRPEAAGPGKFYSPETRGYKVEVYNPAYFRQGGACAFVPPPRSCFEPIYGLVCLDTAEPTYQQPIAFWTSAFANVVAEDIPGAVAARSAVFGFPPVYFNPSEIKPAIEHILFDEWQLPRSAVSLK